MKRNLNTLTAKEWRDFLVREIRRELFATKWESLRQHERDQYIDEVIWLKDNFTSDPEPVDDETLERVIREAIETWHTNEDVNGMNLSAYIEKAIRPYTRGFVPDWDKAPEWATGIAWYFVVGSDPQFESPKAKWAGWSPRPTSPKQRVRKSNADLVAEIHVQSPLSLAGIAVELADGKPIESLCQEYGVDLEKEV